MTKPYDGRTLRKCPGCFGPVYWSVAGANFYCAKDRKGVGWIFYELERDRTALYPTSAEDALR